MKINFDYQIVDAEDLPAKDEKGDIATIKQALRRALLANEDKYKKLELFDLFMKVRSADSDTDFTIDEVLLLDKSVKVYPVLVYGQLHYLLQNQSKQ
jgi:hypothetical protein